MRCTTKIVARKRAESAYRMHYVYQFAWAGIAQTHGYKSAASARQCASRFKDSALAMFFDIPSIERGREIVRIRRQYEENERLLAAAFSIPI